MENNKILWIRKLSCGHSRPTNIAFMCDDFTKPIIGDDCLCRDCNKTVEILDVTKAKTSDMKEINCRFPKKK